MLRKDTGTSAHHILHTRVPRSIYVRSPTYEDVAHQPSMIQPEEESNDSDGCEKADEAPERYGQQSSQSKNTASHEYGKQCVDRLNADEERVSKSVHEHLR